MQTDPIDYNKSHFVVNFRCKLPYTRKYKIFSFKKKSSMKNLLINGYQGMLKIEYDKNRINHYKPIRFIYYKIYLKIWYFFQKLKYKIDYINDNSYKYDVKCYIDNRIEQWKLQ